MNTLYDDLRSLLDSPSRDPIRLREPQSGRRLWSYCPCHADGTKHGRRSLSLDPRFGLTCFGGCRFRDVIAALRERAGEHPDRSRPVGPYRSNGHGRQSRPRGRLTDSWVYGSESGQAIFRVLREELPNGNKQFWQQHPDGSGLCCRAAPRECKSAGFGWAWGRGGAPYELYKLPELIRAGHETYVFLVEGERCADALADLGVVATTAPGGAKAEWRPEYTAALRGRRVVILPDNDRPGVEHAEEAGWALLEGGAEVRFVVLPGLPHKGDIIDWLAAGGTREQLLALAELAPVLRPRSSMFPKAVDTRVLDASKVLA